MELAKGFDHFGTFHCSSGLQHEYAEGEGGKNRPFGRDDSVATVFPDRRPTLA